MKARCVTTQFWGNSLGGNDDWFEIWGNKICSEALVRELYSSGSRVADDMRGIRAISVAPLSRDVVNGLR